MNFNESSCKLSELIRLKQSGFRSINIEQDLIKNSVIEEYILTAQAREILGRILFLLEGNSPSRAWTLTGPYGSGKSYFGLFLMNILGKSQKAHTLSIHQLSTIDPLLASKAQTILNNNHSLGLLPIPITGYKASISECVKHGYLLALQRFNGDEQIRLLIDELKEWPSEIRSREISKWLAKLQDTITHPKFGYSGTLIVFDELGKALEYAASHPENEDIYLLQEIAELANRSEKKPMVFIGILHQAFERYVSFLDSKTQREWNKIQGRFEDIPFQEPPIQQIRLITNSIDITNFHSLDEIKPIILNYAEEVVNNNWHPLLMSKEEFIELSLKSYPLHPSVLIALPFLFKRLAQNERSIFVYLTSHEPYSFQYLLENRRLGDFIRLPDIFDYLSANYQSRLYASGRGRAITESLEKINISPLLTKLEIDVIKTIGILNWLSDICQVQANEGAVFNALRSPTNQIEQIQAAIDNLQTHSQIVYRRFNKTFTIWQGSDVDIDERILQAQQTLRGGFSLASAMQEFMPFRPVIARRHSFQTGTLRVFDVQYLDQENKEYIVHYEDSFYSGKIFLCMASNPVEKQDFINWAVKDKCATQLDSLIGVTQPPGHIRELINELRCLHWVKENTLELHGDPVARKELRVRILTIQQLIRNELEKSFSHHQLNQSQETYWFHNGKSVSSKNSDSLSQIVSNICDKLYSLSPKLHNEILNRNNLSSQGAAARRNLVEGILFHSKEINLGIQGYPPERSMYESLIKSDNLHIRTDEGEWQLSNPVENDPLNLYPTWKALEKETFSDHPDPEPLSELFKKLHMPPYGIPYGTLPVIFCVFFHCHMGEIYLYREGTLLPNPQMPEWELLLRRPDLFSVSGYQVSGSRQAIIQRLAKGFQVKPQVMEVVRSIVLGINSLPEFTKNTNQLSKHAKAVRNAIQNAKSPEKLLFIKLPQSLGLELFDHNDVEDDKLDIFFDHLNVVFRELIQKKSDVITNARDELLSAFGFGTGEDGWQSFQTKAYLIKDYVTNPRFLPIINRVTDNHNPQNKLENVLGLIMNRPVDSWSDLDVKNFPNQVNNLGLLFKSYVKEIIPDESFTPEENTRGQIFAEKLKKFLQKQPDYDPKVVRAALRALLNDLNKEI